ncbi:MAG: spermidine synthase [Actinomycetes bacterium]
MATPREGEVEIDTGRASLRRDRDDPEAWLVVVNGAPSSLVHLADPTVLEFEYIRWMGRLVDALPGPGEPLVVAHLGGAGCTLPRYVAATRPGSRQVVFEVDAALVELARESFGLTRRAGIRLRAADARAGLQQLPAGSQDLVVRDAFAGDVVPAHLQTVEFLNDVRARLAVDGVYVANVASPVDLAIARREAATAREVFAHVAVAAEPAHLRGRRYGNVVLAACSSRDPAWLSAWVRSLSSDPVRARVMADADVAAWVSGAALLRDVSPAG